MNSFHEYPVPKFTLLVAAARLHPRIAVLQGKTGGGEEKRQPLSRAVRDERSTQGAMTTMDNASACFLSRVTINLLSLFLSFGEGEEGRSDVIGRRLQIQSVQIQSVSSRRIAMPS